MASVRNLGSIRNILEEIIYKFNTDNDKCWIQLTEHSMTYDNPWGEMKFDILIKSWSTGFEDFTFVVSLPPIICKLKSKSNNYDLIASLIFDELDDAFYKRTGEYLQNYGEH